MVNAFFCHTGMETDLPQESITDKELWEVARYISGSWFEVGIQLGVKKDILDRIEIENRQTVTMERAAFEMLHRAREDCIYSSSQELAELLEKCREFTAARYLVDSWKHLPKKRRVGV